MSHVAGYARVSSADPSQELEVAPRTRQRVRGPFLLNVTGLSGDIRDSGNETAEVEDPGAELGVPGPIGDHVLDVEAPVPVAVTVEVAHRVSAPECHVPKVELVPHDGRIG